MPSEDHRRRDGRLVLAALAGGAVLLATTVGALMFFASLGPQ